MTNEELRAAIETALRRRDPAASVRAIDGLRDDLAMSDVRVVGVRMRAVAPATPDALRALAVACGLRPDGSDPADEVERLTREFDAAREALRAFAPRCASGAIATWSVRVNEAPTRCDACRRDSSVEHEHAAALRAAGGGR